MSAFSDGSASDLQGAGLSSLFSPAAITASQWKDRRRPARSGEMNLAAAALESAHYDVVQGTRRDAWDVVLWVHADADGLYSFIMVCEALGIEPEVLGPKLVSIYRAREWSRSGKPRVHGSIIDTVKKAAMGYPGPSYDTRTLCRLPEMQGILPDQVHVVLTRLADAGEIRRLGRGLYGAVA